MILNSSQNGSKEDPASAVIWIAGVLVPDFVPGGFPILWVFVLPSSNVLQSLVERTVGRHLGHSDGIEFVHIAGEEGTRVQRSIEASWMCAPGVTSDLGTPLCALHCLVDHARIHCTPKFIHQLRINGPPIASETEKELLPEPHVINYPSHALSELMLAFLETDQQKSAQKFHQCGSQQRLFDCDPV